MRSKSSKRVTEIRALRTHTQSLSGRSLGGLDRAAALPGQLSAASAVASCRRAHEEVRSLGLRAVSVSGAYQRRPVVAALRTLSYQHRRILSEDPVWRSHTATFGLKPSCTPCSG